MRVLFLAAALSGTAALSLAACTVAAPEEEDPIMGDDGSDGTGSPGDPSPDPDPDPDPGTGNTDDCPPSDIGIIDSLKEEQAFIDYTDPDDPDSAAWRGLSGLVTPDDQLRIELWDGYGAFAEAQAEPGDYPIAGEDADPATCGICIEMTMTVGEVAHRMAATGGSLSLESVDGDLKGSGQTIPLREVDENDDLIPGGCSAMIERVVFDAPLEPYGS